MYTAKAQKRRRTIALFRIILPVFRIMAVFFFMELVGGRA